jgi:hypothetical protein
MSRAYRFRWTCSYMGTVDYEIVGDGPVYTATLRREASDYEESIYNHRSPLADWERDVVASIGLLHRSDSRFAIAQEVVDAFNAWRQAEHDAFVKLLRDHPEKYGPFGDDDPLLVPPVPARGAHYQVGTGWIVLPETVERDCMRCEQTFSLPADGDQDFCPACLRNPNRIVLE